MNKMRAYWKQNLFPFDAEWVWNSWSCLGSLPTHGTKTSDVWNGICTSTLSMPRSAIMLVVQLARSGRVNAMRLLSHQTGATMYTPPPRNQPWKVLLAKHAWESHDRVRQPKVCWQYGQSCSSSQARLNLLVQTYTGCPKATLRRTVQALRCL